MDVEGSGCGVIQLLYYQETWENHETIGKVPGNTRNKGIHRQNK